VVAAAAVVVMAVLADLQAQTEVLVALVALVGLGAAAVVVAVLKFITPQAQLLFPHLTHKRAGRGDLE
jgi:ribosomal protein S12 methylthiotransferase accessory factor YcaO